MTPGLVLRLLCVFVFWVFWLVADPARAADGALDISAMGVEPVPLAAHATVLEDAGAALTLAEVRSAGVAARFQPVPANVTQLNYGYTRSAYWLRLPLRNGADQAAQRVLEIANARLSDVQFYQVEGDGAVKSVRTGYRQPFGSRPYPHRFFVFEITVPAHGEQVVYLRLQAPSLQVPVKLWTPQAFHGYEVRDNLGQAWYFGIATAMVLFNLLLFVSLRDVLYLLYVAFVFDVALASSADGGLANQYLWPDSPLWAELSVPVLTSLSVVLFLPFMRRMLSTARVMPGLDRVLRGLVWLWVLAIVGLVGSYELTIKPYALLLMGSMALILVVGVRGATRRERSAYFFLAAFSSLALVGGLSALRVFGLLAFSIPPANLHQMGSAIEMMVLAFALADRYHQLRREKEQAQLDTIHAQAQLNANLERLVQARTNELVEKNRLLEQVSVTDRLTQLYNRLKLDRVLDEELNRHRRYGTPFSLVLMDVDLFKAVNDTYGHPVGDQVLVELAQILRKGVREVDLVGRWGGEEFLVVCCGTDLAGATSLAEKLRQCVQAHTFTDVGHKTCSLGVTGVKAGDSLSTLMARVDAALYRAKATGRNRVVCEP